LKEENDMAFVTGCLVLDAPASALNNAGADEGARTDNAIIVKKIRTPEGSHPYVSAQAVRYWIRTNLEQNESRWIAAPVRREGKIAYTDANPIEYWDDDLFGYMRAQSKKSDATKDQKASPLEKDREITRVSPFRVSTFVSISPVQPVTDFGTMTRQEGNPVPYEHEFYRAHLLGLLSLDLSTAGTFFDGERVGYKNLDSYRREAAQKAGLTEVTLRKQTAYRLATEQRVERVATLIGSLALLNGGAKQALHYTDLTPAVVFLAVTRHGNNPFFRMMTSSPTKTTQFHEAAFQELMAAYSDHFLSDIYIGWAQGFLDGERKKLEEAVGQLDGPKVSLGHPAVQIGKFAELLRISQGTDWYV
jgi:CRISPR-associated protein Cst2